MLQCTRAARGAGLTVLVSVLLAATGTLSSAQSIHAQEYQTSLGWNFGAHYGTSLTSGTEGTVDIEPELAVPSVAMHADHWLGEGRLGIGVQVTGVRSELRWQDRNRKVWSYTGNVSVMLHPLPVSPDRTVVPYTSFGVGTIWWRLGNGPPIVDRAARAVYDGNEGLDLIGTVALGIDIITPWGSDVQPLMVRLEGQDAVQVYSPFEPMSPSESDFGVVHNIRVGIGLHKAIGLLRN